MAKKQMKTPGAPAAARTRRSPLAPTNGQTAPSGLPFDDASVAQVERGVLRAKPQGIGGSDAALGQVGHRAPKATTAGAQYRITGFHPAPEVPEARPTLANGRTVPAVMGSKQRQNFDVQRGVLY